MKKTMYLIAAGALAMVSSVAGAQTYDAFSSFNGQQGTGNFFYGDVNGANAFALYGANTNCFIDGAQCLQRAANHDVPGFAKGGAPAFQYGTVNVPDDRLLGHPAADTSLASVLFLTPTTGDYRITGSFSAQDVSPSGVDLFFLQAFGNALPFTITSAGSLAGAGPLRRSRVPST